MQLSPLSEEERDTETVTVAEQGTVGTTCDKTRAQRAAEEPQAHTEAGRRRGRIPPRVSEGAGPSADTLILDFWLPLGS